MCSNPFSHSKYDHPVGAGRRGVNAGVTDSLVTAPSRPTRPAILARQAGEKALVIAQTISRLSRPYSLNGC